MAPGDWATVELNAGRFVACRMLWQLRAANQVAFKAAGPEEFAASVRSAPNIWCHTMCCKPCYGMQGLEGFDLRAEEAGNYEVMLEVCRLVLAASPQPGRTMRSTDQCLWDG